MPTIRFQDLDPDYELSDLLRHNVMLYVFPPLNEITLPEFEELAIDRLKMLRIFEAATNRHKCYSDEWKEMIRAEMAVEGLKGFLRLMNGHGSTPADLEARRRDYLSHFILRFAYCRTEELRRWFVAREMELFRFKFHELTTAGVRAFREAYCLQLPAVSTEEKLALQEELLLSLDHGNAKVEDMEFFKVRFESVLGLVPQRQCVVKDGFAYICDASLVHFFGPKQEKLIEKGLEKTLPLLPHLERTDKRLWKIISRLHNTYTGENYTVSETEVPVEALDDLSKKSFPLCMRQCHETLRSKHHLKHGGRLQYGLFLKGIGVTLEDSLRFWREEFCKVMDADKFEKSYRYNIRYNYGKEGSKVNWAPHSCMKIISENVGPQDTHGCPFKTLVSGDLKQRLRALYPGLSQAHLLEVDDFAQKHHYQLACGRLFEALHGVDLPMGVTHPNEYFNHSQEAMGKRTSSSGGTTGAPAPGPKLSTTQQRLARVKELEARRWKAKEEENAMLWRMMDDDEGEDVKPPPAAAAAAALKKENESAVDLDDDFDLSGFDEDFALNY